MNRKLLLLGHRGARRYAPENTVASFDLALQHGCDGFEFDVRFTTDRKCVICHDPRVGGHNVAKSRSDQLTRDVPLLPDVLDRFGGRAFLDIELKVSGLETEVASLLRQYPPRRGYFVSSFLPEIIDRLCVADNATPLGLICETERQLELWTRLPIHALFLERKLVTSALVETLHAVHKKVFVWTVNQEREMRRFAGLGLDGIISDDTALLVQTLGGVGNT